MVKELRTNDRSHATMTVDSIAHDALTYAVDYANRCLGAGCVPAPPQWQDVPEGQDYFRYALAARLASVLGGIDTSIRSVYLHDVDETGEELGSTPAQPTSPLTLVVRVKQKSAALEALLEEIDLAVTARYRRLASPAADRLNSLLDFQVVDDQEAREREGYGAIITSFHAPPQQVWTAV